MFTLLEFLAIRSGRKKCETAKDIVLFRHLNNLVNDCLSMFKYENVPETIDIIYFELCLLFNGSVCIYKDNDDIICAQGGDTGDTDIYGHGKQYLCQTVNGDNSVTITKGVDGVTVYNNYTRSPDFNITAFAQFFTELELSENLNVLFSRLTRLPYAEDVKEETKIKEAINSILRGDFACIISENRTVENEFLNVPIGEKYLDLADVRNIPYLQYLSEYYDVLMKRFYTKYGHSLQTTSKHAQVSRDEIRGLDSVSWIYPVEMLECRKKAINETNKIFNTNMRVKFSPIWEREYEKYFANENSVNRIDESEVKIDESETISQP